MNNFLFLDNRFMFIIILVCKGIIANNAVDFPMIFFAGMKSFLNNDFIEDYLICFLILPNTLNITQTQIIHYCTNISDTNEISYT